MALNKSSASYIAGIIIIICLITPLLNNGSLPPSCMEKQWKFFYLSWMVCIPALCLGLTCAGREIKKRLPLFLTCGLLLAGAYEVTEGIRQLSGDTLSAHRLFAVTGTFYNPGPYSGYLAIVFPLCFFLLLKHKSISLYTKVFLWTGIILLLFMMLVSMSRSAWVATIISTIYVWMSCCKPMPRLLAYFRRNIKRNILIAAALIASSALLLVCLFLLKEDSAIGRILIWKISLSAILLAPFTGHGYQSFEYVYGAAQETYFSTVPHRSVEVWVADTPEYAFNEYLQLAVEWGIPALCLAVWGLVFSLRTWHRNGQYGLAGSIIAIAVFAFTSYPLRIPGLLSATLLLLIAGWVIAFSLSRKHSLIVIACVACTACGYCYREYRMAGRHEKSLYLWYDGHKSYMRGDAEKALRTYIPLYGDMQWNANYLLETGCCLQQAGRHYESLHLLLTAETLSSQVRILELIGAGYQSIGCYEKAEEYFVRSSRRVPSRITPYYLLACLYAHPENFHPQEALRMVREVLSRKPKVDSGVARSIQEEARKLSDVLKQTMKQNESDKQISE